ncbi:MAG: hypothetical protein C4318_06400 [Acidimicrobiia bacterium]
MTSNEQKAGDSVDIPADLVPGAIGEEYEFPDIRRRAYGAAFVMAASLGGIAVVYLADDSYSNGGWIAASLIGIGVALYMFACSWQLKISEREAILRAAASLSFPVGPSSISIGWKGILSRPVWRLLAYSGDEPRPKRRGYVAVDAISGEVVDKIDEENPEESWSESGS